MENLNIEATKYTPKIDFNVESKILNITGKSYPENTFEYYKPIVTWIDDFLKEAKDEKILVNLDLEYLNSSSLKAYFDLFDLLEIAQDEGRKIEVKWIYDEENDVREELAMDFPSLNVNLKIKNPNSKNKCNFFEVS